MLTRRRRRSRQRGQVLIMALAFIAFFGLVTVAVLKMAATVFLEQSSIQTLVDEHANAQAAALFAAADAIQRSAPQAGQVLPQGSCVPYATAQAPLQGGVSMGFTTDNCNPGTTADLLANQCSLCVLGPSDIDGQLSAQGPVAFDASPGGSGTVTATMPLAGGATNPGFVSCYRGCPGQLFSGGPQLAQLTQRVSGPAPPAPPNQHGCSPFDPLDRLIPAGTYCLPVDANQLPNYTLEGGTFIFDTDLHIGGGTLVNANGPVLLYFTNGAYLSMEPGSSLSVTAGIRGAGDVVIDFDPSYTCSPCIQMGADTTLNVYGAVYVPNGDVCLAACIAAPSPGATLHINPVPGSSSSGALVTGSLQLAAGSTLSVDSTPPSGGYCWIYDDSFWEGTSQSPQDHVVVATNNCISGGPGIVNINYGP